MHREVHGGVWRLAAAKDSMRNHVMMVYSGIGRGRLVMFWGNGQLGLGIVEPWGFDAPMSA
jgi:hypothetical protein